MEKAFCCLREFVGESFPAAPTYTGTALEVLMPRGFLLALCTLPKHLETGPWRSEEFRGKFVVAATGVNVGFSWSHWRTDTASVQVGSVVPCVSSSWTNKKLFMA